MHCLAWMVGKTSILINAKLLSAYSSEGNHSGGVQLNFSDISDDL